MLAPLEPDAPASARRARQDEVSQRIAGLLAGERDWVAAMATLAAELHHAFAAWHWTGFYRAVGERRLVVGPYQGGHGCLHIAYERGVCGAAARTRRTQRVDDVHAVADHIACSSTTVSEIVVPVITPAGDLLAVLDVDSDLPATFDAHDQAWLEGLAEGWGAQFAHAAVPGA